MYSDPILEENTNMNIFDLAKMANTITDMFILTDIYEYDYKYKYYHTQNIKKYIYMCLCNNIQFMRIGL